MDNTAVTALKDIVDNHAFIENPLDVFDSYTYNLEWFVCDRKATREFQLEEAFNMQTIVNNAWPTPDHNYITIARTGVTTEFTITDLSVESVGVGNSDYSKIAGTADKLSFTVTQVGNTSLADTLQTVVALCGFSSIADAEYFVKINFVGHGKNGKVIPIHQTKVIPFKITEYQQLSTTTDIRGTTTVIRGQVPADKVVMDGSISKTQHNFAFVTLPTLKETLDSFFEKLNEIIRLKDPNVDYNMKHTYKYTFSDQFIKEGWDKGSTQGYSLVIGKNMQSKGVVQAKSSDSISPGSHIYSIVEELCMASDKIKAEAIKDNETYSKILKITPHLIIKSEGYNPVKGEQAYDVEFFIDFERKVVIQNMPDHLNKIKHAKKMVESIFATGHVNKKYDYLFTGNNDQILDFNISLDAELTKLYTVPDDSWAYEHFKKDGNDSIVISEDHQKVIDLAENHFTIAEANYKKQEKIATTAQKEYTDTKNNYRKRLIQELVNAGILEGGMSPGHIDKLYGGYTWLELANMVTMIDNPKPKGGGRSGAIGVNYQPTLWHIGEFNIAEADKRIKALESESKKQNKILAEGGTTLSEAKVDRYDAYAGAMATNLNISHNKDYTEWSENVFKRVRKNSTNSKKLILAEELGSDYVNRLSDEDFKIILKSQASNPVTFRRLIQGMEKGTQQIAHDSGADATNVEMAREKYYEAKGGKLSMQFVDMTIKGDPFWLEGYMPPAKKKEIFKNNGSELQLNLHTKMNGFPHLILNSGIAKGVDENENVKTRTLIYSLYAVRTISSNFTNGIFTQTLNMVKNVEADRFPSEAGAVVKMNEVEGNTNSPGHPSDPTGQYTNPILDDSLGVDINGEPITKHIDDYTEEEIVKKVESITTFDEDEFRKNWAEIQRINKMKDVMKSYGQRTGIGQEPITTAPKWLNKSTEKIIDAQNTTTGHTITAQSGMVGHFNSLADRNLRWNLANQTLDSLPNLHSACLSQQKGLVLPFAACDSIKETNKEMLESFGLTIEDQGKASTVTAMNNQINSWIANDGITFSDEEIAVYQIAAGGELNITGHDPDDIQKLVKRATFERTPQIILDEQASGITTENYYTESGVADNRILDGSKTLNSETIKGTELNTITIEPYQNSDGSIKTDEDFEVMAEEILADTTCVGHCRTKKLMLLGKIEQDAWKAQYKLDKIKDKKVDKIVNESCPEGTKNKMNIKNRRLECVPILSDTLTDNEMNDVDILKEEINKTLEENYYSESGIAEEMAWKANAVELIETELNDNDLVITDKDKTELKIATGTKINNIIALSELSDNDYRKIQGYETGIKTVIATAQDGHRGDLTNAVTVGELQHELETLSADVTASNTKLDGYYFDSTFREVEVKTLEELELQVAVADLSLPSEKITEVATIIDSGVTTLIPIDNPVDQIDVDKAPILIKSGVNTMDVILPGSLKSRYSGEGISWNYAMSNPEKVSQYNEAKKIYKILVSSDFGDMTTVTDDAGNNIKVKDFSNIGPITYTDANGVSQTISNPSTFFGIHTTSYNDINPSYGKDYNDLKGKVADLFPDIKSGHESQLIDGKLPRDSDGVITLRITGDKFYIDK